MQLDTDCKANSLSKECASEREREREERKGGNVSVLFLPKYVMFWTAPHLLLSKPFMSLSVSPWVTENINASASTTTAITTSMLLIHCFHRFLQARLLSL